MAEWDHDDLRNRANDQPDSVTQTTVMPNAKQVLGQNPKDKLAANKVDLSLLPDIAMFHGAHAMMDGARKYGPYNWRDNAVLARVYIGAAKRHIAYWAAGEERAKDSGVHHLGHAIACLSILLDAQATGNLGDDRAKSPELIAVLDELNDAIKAAAEKMAA